MMSDGDKTKNGARGAKLLTGGVCPQVTDKRAEWFYPNLQFKGFAGGVPINTETAAVKPRVGIE